MTGSPDNLIETPHSEVGGVIAASNDGGGEQRPAAPDTALSRALELIHTRYGEPLDIDMLARSAGISRTALCNRFLTQLGDPPMRYCTRWRLRQAAERLREGPESIAEVAYQVGFGSEAAFNRAFKRQFGKPPASWRRLARSELPDLPRQQVRSCLTRDGTRLAWSAVGEGMPLVKTANWLNHLEFDWISPIWRHWLVELLRDHRVIRYDERGNGLSDWDVPRLSFDDFVEDLEVVVDEAGIERFDLFAISQGAAVAIAYSLKHPQRVRRMVLLGGYARGWTLRLSGEDLARREAMVVLSRTGWGSDNPAFRQMFSSLYIPGGTPEQFDWFNELQRISTSPENAERLQRVLGGIDVSKLLEKVSVPTLVAHAKGDQIIPFACGEELARGIPGAEFVPLEGHNHILLADEPAWPQFLGAMRSFLAR